MPLIPFDDSCLRHHYLLLKVPGSPRPKAKSSQAKFGGGVPLGELVKRSAAVAGGPAVGAIPPRDKLPLLKDEVRQ